MCDFGWGIVTHNIPLSPSLFYLLFGEIFEYLLIEISKKVKWVETSLMKAEEEG